MTSTTLIIYSSDNRWRARLDDTADGVRVAFYQNTGMLERRQLNVSLVDDPADLPPCFWKQVEVSVIDLPFHMVRDGVFAVLAGVCSVGTNPIRRM